VDVTRAFIPGVVLDLTVESITLIIAKEIVAFTIVKVTEVRAKVVHANKENSMDVTVKDVTSIVSATQMMATTTGATPRQHLLSDITIVILLTMKTLHRTTTSSIAPLQPF
jgi:hypothetical protein